MHAHLGEPHIWTVAGFFSFNMQQETRASLPAGLLLDLPGALIGTCAGQLGVVCCSRFYFLL